MIKIELEKPSKPMIYFKSYYEEAVNNDEKYPEACAISSICMKYNKVDSRYVNIKYVYDNEFIFFSNYQSPKAAQFVTNNSVSLLFFWPTIYAQIRIKGKIKKTASLFSDNHFNKRDASKNIIAIVSSQSKKIDSYESLIKKFNQYKSSNLISERPDYWGGYSVEPDYFEFWRGHESRINKREVFKLNESRNWDSLILQP